MTLARPARGILAVLASLALGSTLNAAYAGPVSHDTALERSGSVLEPVQYGYGYGYRPYGYRPYGFYPNRRFYNNHFGPGAAKERHRTRLDYCIKQPSKC